MTKNLLALSAALLCSACAILPEKVEVAYMPEPGVPRTSILSPGTVRLEVTDRRRAESPAWVADKKNGYGTRLASIEAQKPVADLVRDALTQELALRGVRVGDGPSAVALEITRFESVYQNRFFVMGAIGSADFSVQVRRGDGSIAFARNFSVSDDGEAGLAGTAGQARRSLERALAKVVGQIISDPAFVQALATGPRTT